jgi:hypothetical protein
MWVLPVTEGPSAMTFSRRSIRSQRANSRTCILFKAGIALKSKLSRLLMAGNFAVLILPFDHPAFRVNHLQFDQTCKELHMVQPPAAPPRLRRG